MPLPAIAASRLFAANQSHLVLAAGSGVAALSIFAVKPVRRMAFSLLRRRGRGSDGPDFSETLCELSGHITQVDLHREPGEQLADVIGSLFELEAVAIFDADLNRIYKAGVWFADPENTLRNVYLFERSSVIEQTGIISEVLRIGRLPIGALLLRGDLPQPVAHCIANLIATTFDRYHSHANVSRTESARQAERLRTTVLDNLAHAYKTPLTAIRAAASGLNEIGSLSSSQSDLVALIEEQSTALNDLTSRLLTTARLEAHDLSLHTERVAIAPLLDDVIAGVRDQLAGAPVHVILDEDLVLRCDRTLLVALLTQYLENAGKYSILGSSITLKVNRVRGDALFSVHSHGPVIPLADQQRIFDRYVRCEATASSTPGTGIGLSVVRAAAQAHGGDAWVSSDEVQGTTFWASLPTIHQEEDAS